MVTAARERAAKRTTPSRPSRSPAERAVAYFRQWLTLSDEAEVCEERAQELRDRILKIVEKSGREDGGHQFLELSEPVKFKDHKGATKVYRVLKREKHVIPANPTPDREKALKLLKDMGLWLTPKQEKTLQEIGLSNPYVTISVNVDADAVAQMYFKELIDEATYDAILVEQKNSFQFRKLTR